MKRIQSKVAWHHVVESFSDGIHEPLRHNLADAVPIGLRVGGAEVSRRARKQPPVKPVIGSLLVFGQHDIARVAEESSPREEAMALAERQLEDPVQPKAMGVIVGILPVYGPCVEFVLEKVAYLARGPLVRGNQLNAMAQAPGKRRLKVMVL